MSSESIVAAPQRPTAVTSSALEHVPPSSRIVMLPVKVRASALVAALCTVTAGHTHATTFSFTTINAPGAAFTSATGINNTGQIVGSYDVSYENPELFNTDFASFAFVYTNGHFTTLMDPQFAAPFPYAETFANGINDAGQIVGNGNKDPYPDSIIFLDTKGNFTNPAIATGFEGATATGINDGGQIVGNYFTGYVSNDGSYVSTLHGFLDTNGSFTNIDAPGAARATGGETCWCGWTSANGINDAGQIVGTYYDSVGAAHGFLDTNGSFTNIDAPRGTGGTSAKGINDAGQIVGTYYDSVAAQSFPDRGSPNIDAHGFLDTNGSFTNIAAPGATGGTSANGINDAGQIVGSFGDGSSFLAVPETVTIMIMEPPGVVVFATGLFSLGLIRRWRIRKVGRCAPIIADRPSSIRRWLDFGGFGGLCGPWRFCQRSRQTVLVGLGWAAV